MFYKKEKLEKVVFFDIETVPFYHSLADIMENAKNGEREKIFKMAENQGIVLNKETEEDFINGLSLVPELNQIVCLSFGIIKFERDNDGNITDKYKSIIKSFSSLTDENTILDKAFKTFDNKDFILGGFNILNFDIPILTKHYLRKGKIPSGLNLLGKKPWEINILDLCLDWKGTSQYLTSLSLLCDFLGVKNSKEGYLNNKNIFNNLMNGSLSVEELEVYCEQDVKSTIECCIKLSY